MRTFRVSGLVNVPLLFTLILATFLIAPRVFSQDAQGRIKGTVTSSDGKPMEGVTVSVRGQGESFVTSVFTNEHGVYAFPPLGSNTKYSLWAQAQGFDIAKTDATLGKQVATLQLKPLKDYSKQMTGVEWMESFPENTPQEKREKQIFAANCSGCHENSFPLQNRFDADGWSKIIAIMSHDSEGVTLNPNNPGSAAMNEYKDELVAFLTKVRGPEPPKYALKTLPRPTGDAARVVITEYDVTRPEAPPESYVHNGSDWTEGTPSRWEGRASHDATVGGDGHVYFSDDRSMNATIFELDPKTAKITLLPFPSIGKVPGTAPSHGIGSTADGNIWADVNGDFLEFDVKTQKFKDWPRPADMKTTVGGFVEGDKWQYKNIVWAAEEDGAIKMDINTGKYTVYPMPDTHKGTYGFTVDRHGNGWYASPAGDRVYEVDAETGKTADVIFEPLGPETGMEIREKDKEAYANLRVNQNSATPLHSCPRRLGADHNSDVIWVALFCADKLARVDAQTREVTEIALPHKWSMPYGLVVDNEHNVWIDALNTDMVIEYNPTAKKFTEYHMPSRGTDIRHLTVDYSTGEKVVWIAYNKSNKVAKMEFRKASDME